MAREYKKPEFELVEQIQTLHESTSSDFTIEINKVAWGKKPPQIDIRRWNQGDVGNPIPLKGVSLTDEACDALAISLLEMGYGDMKKIRKIYNDRRGK